MSKPQRRPEGVRHFLDIADISPKALRAIIEDAKRLKAERAGRPKGHPDAVPSLQGETVGLIFEKPSTRTRISFDVGVRQLGGAPMVLTGAEMQLGRGETIADTARVLSRYLDLIMIRTFSANLLHELAENATVPVINGLTDKTHPCQIMADILTFEEKKGQIQGKKIVWSGDGNNVCASFLQAAAAFDFELVVASPDALRPDARIWQHALSSGARVRHSTDLVTAVEGADAVVTDTWLSMHDADATRQVRVAQLSPFQVTAQIMAQAQPDAIFMHCLPAHRGEEVTSEVFDSAQSVVFDEAENRLHIQKSIIRWCLGGVDV